MWIALDSGIGATHPNPVFRFVGRCPGLEWAVLEVKGAGPLREPLLPPGIPTMRLSRAAFSKYGECVSALLTRRGA